MASKNVSSTCCYDTRSIYKHGSGIKRGINALIVMFNRFETVVTAIYNNYALKTRAYLHSNTCSPCPQRDADYIHCNVSQVADNGQCRRSMFLLGGSSSKMLLKNSNRAVDEHSVAPSASREF